MVTFGFCGGKLGLGDCRTLRLLDLESGRLADSEAGGIVGSTQKSVRNRQYTVGSDNDMMVSIQ